MRPAQRMAGETPGITLQATALVHEAWVRREREQKGWESRAQFFAAAAGKLRLVANFGAGVDHIDVAAANARGVTVSNTPSVLAEDAIRAAIADYQKKQTSGDGQAK